MAVVPVMTSMFDAQAIFAITEVTHDMISNTNASDDYSGMEPTQQFQSATRGDNQALSGWVSSLPIPGNDGHKMTFQITQNIVCAREWERTDKSYIPQCYRLLNSFGKSRIVSLSLCHLASLGKRQRASRKLGRDKRYYSAFLSFPHEYVWSEVFLTLDGSQRLIDYSITLQDSICCCRLAPRHIECRASDFRECQEAGSTGCWKDYK